jgi:iron complex outermembrane receptor protein
VHGRKLDGTPRIFRAGLFQKGSNKFNAGFDKDEVSIDGLTGQKLKQWGSNLHLQLKAEGLGTFYSVTGYERATVVSQKFHLPRAVAPTPVQDPNGPLQD